MWAIGEFEEDPCAPPCGSRAGILWRLDPAANNLLASTRFESTPSAIAVGAGAVWIGQPETRSVLKLDPESLEVLAKIKLDNVPGDVAVLGRFVWVAVP